MTHPIHHCFLLVALISLPAFSKQPNLLDELLQRFHSHTDTAPATAQIESGFSPEGGAERLILKIIHSADKKIRLASYSFTSPTVVRALADAKRNGVDIQVVVDDSNTKSKSGRAALNLLVKAGISVRTSSKYAIHHDKYIVSDDLHVQTGSFNYSRAAATSNSENVIVIWHNQNLAASYARHWESRYRGGKNYKAPY